MTNIENSLRDEFWRLVTVKTDATIEHVIHKLNQFAIKIVLVVGSAGELVGTISDGDIRRGLLNGLNITSPIETIIHRNALVAPPDMSHAMVMQLMVANKILQIPVVDADRRVVGLHLWDEIIMPPTRPNLMVIMAGGMGTRLLPHTENCPKPMLHVADKPMLEHIIDRAKLEGFVHFVIAIHYLGQMIEDYFGNGVGHLS